MPGIEKHDITTHLIITGNLMRILSGWLIMAMLAGFWLSQLVEPITAWLLPLIWLPPLLLWRELSAGARRQSLLLLLPGGLLLLLTGLDGGQLPWQQLLGANLPLLAMFTALSFLGLAGQQQDNQPAPHGGHALWSTMLGINLLGAVINMSILFVAGDKLQRQQRLSDQQLMVLGRAFCAAAWWSPFFIATGVALTYAPGMQWRHTFIPGLLAAALMMVVTFLEARHHPLEQFQGYPLRPDSLWLPLLLAATVLLSHTLAPQLGILVLISLLAPLCGLLFMPRRGAAVRLKEHIHERLPGLVGQFWLFLSAGVFSTAISTTLKHYPHALSLPFDHFGPIEMSVVLALMILVSLVGIHPLVSVSISSPLLLPLAPDPDMLGFMYLSGWAIGTATSPLSGVGLALCGRYQATPRQILRLNWRYALIMWLLASLLNPLLLG